MTIPWRKIFIIQLLLPFSLGVFAQTAWTDSIRKVVASQQEDTNKLASLLALSWSYQTCYPDSGVVYAQKAMALAEKLHDDPALFESGAALNASLYYTGNYPLQLDNTFRALALAKRSNNPWELSYANSMLADYYYNLGEYTTSLAYGMKVVHAIEEQEPTQLEFAWGYLSRLYAGMGQFDSALLYASKGYQRLPYNKIYAGRTYQYERVLNFMYTLLGNAFTGKNNYDSALYYYRLGIPHAKTFYFYINMVDDYTGMAAVFKMLGRRDSAEWYARKVIDERIARAYPVAMLKATEALAEIYESKKQPDSALKYLRLTLGLKDSLFAREKMLEIQHTAFKAQEKQQELVAANLRWQNQFRIYSLAAGFTIILIAAGIAFRKIRQKQLQKMRNKIADDLHDDIGSTLSSISIISELAKKRSPEALPFLTTIGESTHSLQENMSDIVWAVNPVNDYLENVLARMNSFAAEILEAKNIELDLSCSETLSPVRLNMTQRKNLYLFFKEAINNVAKHSEATAVSVSIDKRDHHIKMQISDNGKGFDTGRIIAGNGMTTLKKRGEELNGKVDIESIIGKGTVVRLSFKIT